MPQNTGVKVTLPGINASTTARPQGLSLNASYPLHKLDVTKSVSFQNFLISFSSTPSFASPPSATSSNNFKTTSLYSFAHGYTYIPATWVMAEVDTTNNTGVNVAFFCPKYQFGNPISLGYLTGATDTGGAYANNIWLTVTADKTNVYLKLVTGVSRGDSGTIGQYMSTVGFTVKLRLYVFAEDLEQN